MAKTATEFLHKLAQRELVPPKIVDSLRRQVADKTKPISPATIARLLVEKGHLTVLQAEGLLGGPLPQANKPPTPSSLPEATPMGLDLGLAPLEQIPAPTGPSISNAAKPADATTALEPLELGLLDLLPLDEPAPATAKVAPKVRPLPAAATNKLPAPKPAAAPLGPSAALTPLPPLDGLEPLASPLTPISQPASHLTAKRRATAAVLLAPGAQPTAAPHAIERRPRAWWWIGGIAGVVLLAVLGALAGLFLSRDKGPNPLELADQEYKAGRYAAAMENYDAFLAESPRDEKAGRARVRRAVAKLLAARGSGDNWPAVLAVANEVLAEIEGEASLADVHSELAPLLTDMATALAKAAEEAPNDAAASLNDARRALILADNGRFVPGALRDWQRLAEAAETLATCERKQQSRQSLERFAASAKAKLANGDFASFVAGQNKLLDNYPELIGDPQLAALASECTLSAAAAVLPLSELPPVQTNERETRSEPLASSGSANVFVARAGGTIWALDAATGKALWRREIASQIDPVPASDDSVLLVDAASEVLCLVRQDGALRWRIALDSPLAGPPLVSAGRVIVTTTAGCIFTLALKSGVVSAGCRLPVPAGTSAAADPAGKLLYQPAAADFLFVLNAADLAGQAAIFVGHAPYSLQVSPLVFPGRLIVAECRPLAGTVLHALTLDETGALAGGHDRRELPREVLTPPIVFGDRLIVLTDAGVISQFQVPAAGDKPLKKLGEMSAASAEPHLTFGLIAGDRLSTAGAGLALFELTAKEDLKPKWSRWDDNWFSSPPQQFGNTIYSVRRAGGTYVAAAVNWADGQPLWETPLAAPQEAAP